jgi:hypothetical protein
LNFILCISIVQANDELHQKILQEGPQSVQIDSHLHQPEPAISGEDKMDTVDDNESEETSDNDDIVEEHSSEQQKTEKVVELNFALGDFDQSNIALLEELAKEENEEDSNDNEDNDDDA